jgi:hypothetical protein
MKTSPGISRSGGAGWLEATRGSGNGRPAGEEDKSDSQLKRREPKGKMYFANTPSTRGLARPTMLNLARERREASGANWANGRVGCKVGRAESKKKEFLN